MEVPKYTVSPMKSRIYLKANKGMHSKKYNRVPAIRIELDQLLTEAYSQLRVQPKKNLILGNKKDVYVLDNNILKQYISHIYDEYRIDDPMLSVNSQDNKNRPKQRSLSHNMNNLIHKNMRSKSTLHLTNKMLTNNKFDTPKKVGSFREQNYLNSTISNKKISQRKGSKNGHLNKSQHNISVLKSNFKAELNSQGKQIIIRNFNGRNHAKIIQEKDSYQKYLNDNINNQQPKQQHQNQQVKFPHKIGSKKLKVRLFHKNSTVSKQSGVNQANRSSSVRVISLPSSIRSSFRQDGKKEKYSYCIFCGSDIKKTNFHAHHQLCIYFQHFTQKYGCNPPLKQIIKLIKQKISYLTKYLLQESGNLRKQASVLELTIQNYINQRQIKTNVQADLEQQDKYKYPVTFTNNFSEQTTPLKSLDLHRPSKPTTPIAFLSDQSNFNNQNNDKNNNQNKVSGIYQIVQQSSILQCYKQLQKYQYYKQISSELSMIYNSRNNNAEKLASLQQKIGFPILF